MLVEVPERELTFDVEVKERGQERPRASWEWKRDSGAGLMGHAAPEKRMHRGAAACEGAEEEEDFSFVRFSQPSLQVS